MRGDAVATARGLVARRFPDARAAWLGGSVVQGRATPTSDLDITVVLPELAGTWRESLVEQGWPVELFVHTLESVRHYVTKDVARRRPTMARLVSEGRLLVDHDGVGEALARECAAVVAAGPPLLSPEDLELRRYGLTDLLDDLAGHPPPAELAAVATALWQESAELLLAAHRRWGGSGKWLVRELESYDAAQGSTYASRLTDGLREALAGRPEPLTTVVDDALATVGGRLWAGFRAEGRRS
jgi:hypothetical protein